MTGVVGRILTVTKTTELHDAFIVYRTPQTTQMKRRGVTPEGQTLEGLVSGAEKSQEEFDKVEASRVVVSVCGGCYQPVG